MEEQAGEAQPAAPATPPVGQPGWIRIVALFLLVTAIGFLVARFAKRDVVTNWQVLASCQTVTDIGSSRVSTAVDTTPCLIQPPVKETNTGWPLVTFVLPSDVGSDPHVTTVTSDITGREMSIAYDSPPRSKGGNTGGHTLVFVEVPPGDVPPVPFSVHDAAGTTVVTTGP